MSDQQSSFQEKSEEATPKRREDARKEGQVARSMEVNSAAVLTGTLGAFLIAGTWMRERLVEYMHDTFAMVAHAPVNMHTVPKLLEDAAILVLMVVGPVALGALVMGIIANVGQFGFLVSGKQLEPRFDKLSPLKGLKQMLSMRTLVELIKNVFKVSFIGLGIYLVLKKKLPTFLDLVFESPIRIFEITAAAGWTLLSAALVLMFFLAIADFLFQQFDHSKQLRMTHQEVKEERKQTDGDPLIKSRQRGLAQETAYNRMIRDLPTADVVLTNPTTLAVALKYKPGEDRAPRIIAKGKRLMAERIKSIAAEHDIPVIENKPLARRLFAICDVGSTVPGELYRAVAEVLAFVFRQRRKSA
jgi:flagellar biosynthesis protein FlhB